jgi:hypothetical protein
MTGRIARPHGDFVRFAPPVRQPRRLVVQSVLSFGRAEPLSVPYAAASPAAAPRATARSRLCAIANHNTTVRTFDNPRTRN